MHTRVSLRSPSVSIFALFLSLILVVPAFASNILIPCGDVMEGNFVRERRIKVRVANIGDCTAHIQAFMGRDLSGEMVVDLALLGGEVGEINFPGVPNGGRTGRLPMSRSCEATTRHLCYRIRS